MFDQNNNTFWHCGFNGNSNLAYTQNPYNGTYQGGGTDCYFTTHIINVGDIGGEWIQIEMPYAIIINSYNLYPKDGLWGNKYGNITYLVGSNNNIDFYLIKYVNLNNVSPSTTLVSYDCDYLGYYIYIRLIINAVGPGADVIHFAEMKLYEYVDLYLNSVLLNGEIVNNITNVNILPNNNLLNIELTNIQSYSIPTNPWAFYSATNFSNNQLFDLTGNGRDATCTGNVQLATGSGNGASVPIPYLYGNTGDQIIFPEGSLPNQFTLCSLTRYTNGSCGRIISSPTENWFHGHWSNRAGVAFYEGWYTMNHSIQNNQQWLCFCGGNSTNINAPYNFISNGNYVGELNGGYGNGRYITINNNQYGENSDFAFSVLLIYDRWLTQDELIVANNFLQNYLLIGLLLNTFCLKVSVIDNSSNQILFNSNSNWKYIIGTINYNSYNNYYLQDNITGNIYCKPLNVISSYISKPYDTTTYINNPEILFDGVINPDIVYITNSNGYYLDYNVSPNNTINVVDISLNNPNYIFNNFTISGVILPTLLSIQFYSLDKMYDKTLEAFVNYYFTNLYEIDNDQVDISNNYIALYADYNVNNNIPINISNINLTGLKINNYYTLQTNTISGIIYKKDIISHGLSKMYDGTINAFVSLSNIIYPDLVTYIAYYNDPNAENNKLINVSISSYNTTINIGIIKIGLLIYLDVENINSYNSSNPTIWNNLISNYTFVNGLGNSILLLPNWTIEIWYYYDNTNIAGYSILNEIYNFSLGPIISNNANQINVGFYSNNQWYSASQISDYTFPTNNTWYHIVGTYDSSNIKLYVNTTETFNDAVLINNCNQVCQNNGLNINLMTNTGGQLSVLRLYDYGLSYDNIYINWSLEFINYVSLPNQPFNVVAYAGNNQARLEWSPPTNNGGTPIIKYLITSDTDNINVISYTTECTIYNLTNDIEYIFKVKTINNKGYSVDISNNQNTTTDTVLTNLGLSYFYKFTENDIVNNKVKNYATNQYDATVYNGASIQNSSLYLNGSNQYIQLDTFNTTNNGLTIAAWFNVSSGGWARLIDFGNGAGSDNILYAPGNGAVIYVGGGGTQNVAGGYADNTWHHFVWTMNPNNENIIYIDGNVVFSSSFAYPRSGFNRSLSYIGQSNWGDPYLVGYIYNFMIFDSVLSQTNVNFIKNYSSPVVTNISNSVIPSNIYSNNPSIASYSAGLTPFIANVIFTNIDIINLVSIKFEIEPQTNSVTLPVSATYDYGYLSTNNLINYTNRTVTVCVFGLYASSNKTSNTVTFNINTLLSTLITISSTITTSVWQVSSYNPNKIISRDNSVYLGFSYFLLKEFQDTIGPIIIDTDGEVRWVNTSGANSQSSLFFNNAIFTGTGTTLYRTQLNGTYTLLKDYSSEQISGSNINTITHHNIDFGKTGILICTGTNAYCESSVIEVDYNGNILYKFDVAQSILTWMTNNGDGANAQNFVIYGGNDWFHNNANCYWSEFNELILSGREDFIIAIDYDTQEIKWILGDTDKAWYQNFVSLKQFSLTLLNSTLPPIGQHAPSITFDSNLLLFDDGYQSFDHNPSGSSRSYAAGRMYQIDRINKTANEIYTFDSNKQILSQITSSIYQTHDSEGETYLINFAAAGGGPILFGLGIQDPSTKNIPIGFKYQYGGGITAGWNAIQINLHNLNFSNLIAPQPPTHIIALVLNTSVNVSWTASNSANSYIITSSDNNILTTTNTNITFDNLILGSTYFFTVIAVNIIGNSLPSLSSNLINLFIGNNNKNYNLQNNITYGDIYKKSVYAYGTNKEYDNTPIAYLTFSGMINNDIIMYNAFYQDKNIDINKLINIIDYSGYNYILENYTTYGNIISKLITVNFLINKIYDKTQNITNYTYELVGTYNENVTLSNSLYGLYRDYNVNSNILVDISNIYMYGIDSNNYTIYNYLTCSGNIDLRVLTFETTTKIYDNSPNINLKFSNIIYPDKINYYNSYFDDSLIGNDKLINVQLFNYNDNQPYLINDLQLWLDANDYSTLVFTNNTVSEWHDKSNYIRNATPHGNGCNIIYNSTGINNLPTLVFNSTNGFAIPIPSGTFTTGMSVFVVFQKTGPQYYDTVFNRTSGNNADPLDMYNNNRYINGTTYIFSSSFNIGTATNLTIFNITIDNQGHYNEYTNNNLILSLTTNQLNDNGNNFYIGIRADGDVLFNGNISEIIVYNRGLTDDERTTIFAYLNVKWKNILIGVSYYNIYPPQILLNNYLLNVTYGNITQIPIYFNGVSKTYDLTTIATLTLSSHMLYELSGNNITYDYTANYITPYVGYNKINVTGNLYGSDANNYTIVDYTYGYVIQKYTEFVPTFIKQYDGTYIAYIESYTLSGAYLQDISFIDISYNAFYSTYYPEMGIYIYGQFSLIGELSYNYTIVPPNVNRNVNNGLTATLASSSGTTLHSEFPELENKNYYINPINGFNDLFYTRMDIEEGGWMLIYEFITTRQNNTIPYTVNKSASLGTTPIIRVAYYMQNNDVWAWVSFDYQSSGMTQYDIPTGGIYTNVFINSNIIYNMNVISNSENITNVTNITGYIQTWPSNYNTSSLGGYNLYNSGYNTEIGYGAFNIWNLNTLDCIFAFNNHSSETPCIGFGNGPSNKDWTFANGTLNNFKFQIYVKI
jgi:hypothetical protein